MVSWAPIDSYQIPCTPPSLEILLGGPWAATNKLISRSSMFKTSEVRVLGNFQELGVLKKKSELLF